MLGSPYVMGAMFINQNTVKCTFMIEVVMECCGSTALSNVSSQNDR